MILKIERESVYKTAKVTEPNGDVRLIKPIFFNQMLWKGDDGKYRYDNKVPKNFWAKHDFLKSKGWEQGYHYDIDWYKGEWDEHYATTTEQALIKEGWGINATYHVLPTVLDEMIEYIEETDQQIEWEWGSCRSLQEVKDAKEMPDIYYKLISLKKKKR